MLCSLHDVVMLSKNHQNAKFLQNDGFCSVCSPVPMVELASTFIADGFGCEKRFSLSVDFSVNVINTSDCEYAFN